MLKPNLCISERCQNKCLAKFTEDEKKNIFKESKALSDASK